MATDNSKRKRGRKILLIIGVAALCIAVIVCIILPPSLGRTKPFIDEYGNILEGSISEKTFVEINGASLGIFIMAKDSGSPVLLFLGGGPVSRSISWNRSTHQDWRMNLSSAI